MTRGEPAGDLDLILSEGNFIREASTLRGMWREVWTSLEGKVGKLL